MVNRRTTDTEPCLAPDDKRLPPAGGGDSHQSDVQLPRDLFAHHEVATEWWYYSGHLQSAGRPFGFEVTFFRRRLDDDRIGRFIPARVITPVAYFAHLSLADIEAGQFHYEHHRPRLTKHNRPRIGSTSNSRAGR